MLHRDQTACRACVCSEFKYVDKAIAFEKQVKGWSRKKKEAIIRDNWEALKELAECGNGTTWKRER
jgi:putative endonuclease